MYNHSIIFLFLVFRDIIVAIPRICDTVTFDMQWCYVIGIPRDLFFKIAVKIKPFIFFPSTIYGENKMVIKVC